MSMTLPAFTPAQESLGPGSRGNSAIKVGWLLVDL
jgi:hypothetical protein